MVCMIKCLRPTCQKDMQFAFVSVSYVCGSDESIPSVHSFISLDFCIIDGLLDWSFLISKKCFCCGMMSGRLVSNHLPHKFPRICKHVSDWIMSQIVRQCISLFWLLKTSLKKHNITDAKTNVTIQVALKFSWFTTHKFECPYTCHFEAGWLSETSESIKHKNLSHLKTYNKQNKPEGELSL